MKIDFLPNDVQNCITACWDCRTHCQKMLFHHCLEMGGKHSSPGHVRLMTDCMEICQTTADFLVRGSAVYQAVAAACAEVCYACADSCEDVGGEEMNECAQLCRECAEICDDLSLTGQTDIVGDADTAIRLSS